jgi:TIR domain-containing protein
MPSVFISHKRGEQDDPIARLLAEELEKLGCSVYLDLNRPRAMEIDKEIPAYLDKADFVIAIISAAANDSDWVKGELKRAASFIVSPGAHESFRYGSILLTSTLRGWRPSSMLSIRFIQVGRTILSCFRR